MRTKMILLAFAYLAVSGLLMAVTYAPQTQTTAKTDRMAGSDFLVERFAG